MLFFNTFFRPLKADDHRQNDDVEDFERSLGLLSDYADAERHGKNNGQCGKRYGMCPFSIHSILPKVTFIKNSFMLILLIIISCLLYCIRIVI